VSDTPNAIASLSPPAGHPSLPVTSSGSVLTWPTCWAPGCSSPMVSAIAEFIAAERTKPGNPET
jgi:hypothetical protein